MKPIVFDTVIDGKLYTFSTKQYKCEWFAWTNIYTDSKFQSVVSGKSEEDAILQLVKAIEK